MNITKFKDVYMEPELLGSDVCGTPTYLFTSYNESGIKYSDGIVMIMAEDEIWTELLVLENYSNPTWVGRTVYVKTLADGEGSDIHIYEQADESTLIPDVVVGLNGEEYDYVWVLGPDDYIHTDPAGRTVMEFCDYFNANFRNRYAYVVNWKYVLPLTINTGNPFGPEPDTYVYYSLHPESIPGDTYDFDTLSSWMDQATVLTLTYNEQNKYRYLNEFTPDSDITIDELKQFRSWLAGILLENHPYIDEQPSPVLLTTMLTYYKQNMKDCTTDALIGFQGWADNTELVAGMSSALPTIAVSAGCGCASSTGLSKVQAVQTTACDPLNTYRRSVYNFMVSVFSDIDYWVGQPEICEEMKKYIEGILRVGLPLASSVLDPYADCSCSSVNNTEEARYRAILERLVIAIGHIINGTMSGNRNSVASAFSDWAKYLYESMYWE